MGTKKGNDDDDSYGFDPLEGLADVVFGDAFTFFDEPVKAVEKATNGNDTGTARKDASDGRPSGGERQSEQSEPRATIKPLEPPTKKGKATGESKQAEGGGTDGDGKDKPDGDKEPKSS